MHEHTELRRVIALTMGGGGERLKTVHVFYFSKVFL